MKFTDLGIDSRLFLGSAGYPNLSSLVGSIQAANSQIVTVSMRRHSISAFRGNQFLEKLQNLNIKFLPNTSGCYNAKDAVNLAKMARDVFETNFIKLEVVCDEETLAPHPKELINAAEELNKDNFLVFPYTSDDIGLCKALSDVGCKILMPGGSPIGSGNGIQNIASFKKLRSYFPEHLLILDAGVGRPSDASIAMEMGYDAVLVNSAIAKSIDPVKMSLAFKNAVLAGRQCFEAGAIAKESFAIPSSPMVGIPFDSVPANILQTGNV